MRSLKYIGLCLLVLSLLVPGCARKYRLTGERLARSSAWPYHRGGLEALGASAGRGFDGRLDIVWEIESSGKPAGPLTLYYGVLVYLDTKAKIKFYDKLTGQYLGRQAAKGSAQTGLAINDTLGYFATSPSRNKLYCVDLLNRRRVWSRHVKDAAGGTIIVDNRLIVASGNGVLRAFDPCDGHLIWKLETDSRFAAPPSFGRGRLFQPGDNGVLYAVSVDKGQEIYSVELEGPLISAVAVSELIHAVDMKGHVYGIDPRDGRIVWQKKLAADVWTAPAASNGRLFIGHSGGGVVAFEAATGEEFWRFNTVEVVRASVTVVGEFVIVGTMGGRLYCLGAEDGTVVDERQLRGGIAVAPVSDGERVYVATQLGMIICFGDTYGTQNENDQRSNSLHQPERAGSFSGPRVGHGGKESLDLRCKPSHGNQVPGETLPDFR